MSITTWWARTPIDLDTLDRPHAPSLARRPPSASTVAVSGPGTDPTIAAAPVTALAGAACTPHALLGQPIHYHLTAFERDACRDDWADTLARLDRDAYEPGQARVQDGDPW